MTSTVELFRSERIRVVDHRCTMPVGGCGCATAEGTSHITLARRGCFNAHVGRRQWLVSADSAFLYRAGTEFKVAHPAPGGDDCTLIYMPESLIDEAFGSQWDGYGICEVGMSGAAQLRHASLLGRVRAHRADVLEAEEAVLELVSAIATCQKRPLDQGADSRSARLVARARERLHGSLDRNLSMQTLSGDCGVSAFHLMRLFRRHTGMSIRAYRRRLRAHQACFWITEGDESLSDIALGCGFSSQSHMTDSLKRELGIAPGRLRKSPSHTSQ